MGTYLAIITTTLVLTQIIRVIQNTKQLKYLSDKKHNNEVIETWKRLEEAINTLSEIIEYTTHKRT